MNFIKVLIARLDAIANDKRHHAAIRNAAKRDANGYRRALGLKGS